MGSQRDGSGNIQIGGGVRNRSGSQVSGKTTELILLHVGQNPLKTASEISAAVNVCISSVRRALAELQSQKIVIKKSKFRYIRSTMVKILNVPPQPKKTSDTSMLKHPIVLWALGDGRHAGSIVSHRKSQNWDKT